VELICYLLFLCMLLVFARIILSWFPPGDPAWFMSQLQGFLYRITEPLLGPIRRVMPPIGMGGMGLDLSPIIVIIGIQVLRGVISC
jgi:YggT family protein